MRNFFVDYDGDDSESRDEFQQQLIPSVNIHPIVGVLFGTKNEQNFREFILKETSGVVHSASTFLEIQHLIDPIRQEICTQAEASQNSMPTTIPSLSPRLRIIFTFSSCGNFVKEEDFHESLWSFVTETQYYYFMENQELETLISLIGCGMEILDLG